MSMTRFIPILGMLVILAAAALLSKNRKAIPWRTVGIGIGVANPRGVIRAAHEFGLLADVQGLGRVREAS